MTDYSKNRMTVYMDKDLSRRLKMVALQTDTSASKIIRELIDIFLEKHEKPLDK